MEPTPPTDPAPPREGRLLGIDFGTKRLGVAVSTFEQNIASPLENFARQSRRADADFLKELIDEYRVVGLVVGLPVHMSGDEGGVARQAREFGAWLQTETGLPVAYWDERFTSQKAEAVLQGASLTSKKRKQRKDKLAAMFLLQSYLDAPDRAAPPPSLD